MPGWWRSHRTAALLTVVVLVALGIVVAAAGPSGHAGSLDPGNPDPKGAQAVARVLDDHGVVTTVARGEQAFARTAVRADTTVMVTAARNLGNATSRQLAAHASAAGHVVLVAPPPETLRAFHLPLQVATVRGSHRPCAAALLAGLRPVTTSTVGYRSRSTAVCPAERRNGATYASIVTSGDTTVVGAFDVFRNDTVTRGDNAAIALRLLGQGSRLDWYVPNAADIPVGDGGSVAALLPSWLAPGLLLAIGALLALLLWQGRRLGPVVSEPLPVTVKAGESATSRGRLYRRSRDRQHAASILRRAAAVRLGADLHLARGSDVEQVAARVAERTGRDPAAVRDRLVESSVPDEAALVQLAGDLAALEKEVRRE